jgi:hypothetical protein
LADLGELIGGIMSGLNRARRDADVTSALIAEEYRVNSLLSAVSAPRVRLSEVTIDLPVILSPPSDEKIQQRKSGAAMTHSAVLQTFVSRLTEIKVPSPVITEFIALAEPELSVLFGDQVRGISGESISRIAQKSLSTAYENVENKKSKESEAQTRKSKTSDDEESTEDDSNTTLESARIILDLESRRIGRELAAEFPTIEAIAETQTIKDMGSENSITRVKLKLIEEGLEWTTIKDEQGNSINRLISE